MLTPRFADVGVEKRIASFETGVTEKRVWGVGCRRATIKNFSSEFRASVQKQELYRDWGARYKESLLQSHVFKRGLPTPYTLSPTPSEAPCSIFNPNPFVLITYASV